MNAIASQITSFTIVYSGAYFRDYRDQRGSHSTDFILVEFEILRNFVMLLFSTYSVDHNQILHTSRQ